MTFRYFARRGGKAAVYTASHIPLAGTGTSSPDFFMDMADFNGPGSESEASIKVEELPETPNQEPGGRWRGPEQMNVGKTHFYNY